MHYRTVLTNSVILSMLTVLFLPFATVGVDLTTTSDGSIQQTIDFAAAGSDSTSVAFDLPKDAIVRGANINVSTAPHTVGGTDYPTGPSFDLGGDGTKEWQFSGTGYGRWGYQNQLADGTASSTITWTTGGSDSSVQFLVPANATINQASLDVLGLPYGWTAWAKTVYAGDAIDGDDFGNSVANIGDIDQDGFDDLAVGDSGFSLGDGQVSIFRGRATGFPLIPDTILNPPASNAGLFGFRLDGGDFNGDGYSDLLVSEPFGGTNLDGAIYVYYGSATGLPAAANWTYNRNGLNERVAGIGLATVGDLNRDGADDFAFGDWNTSGIDPGTLFVIYGRKVGPLPAVPDHTIVNPAFATLSAFGLALDGVDINGDGDTELVVADALHGNGPNFAGRFYVWNGSGAGIVPAGWFAVDGTPGQLLGASITNVSDVNGDGFDDLVVSAEPLSAAIPAARVYKGGATGLPPAATWTYTAPIAGENYYESVARGGFDANGDGIDDLLFGNFGADVNNGSVIVQFGGAGGPSTGAPDIALNGTGNQGFFGISIAAFDTVPGDSFDDFVVGAPDDTVTGKATLFYSDRGYPLNLQVSVGDVAPADFTDTDLLSGGFPITVDFTSKLPAILAATSPAAYIIDSSGNALVKVGVNITSQGKGILDVTNLSIEYSDIAKPQGLTDGFNTYLAAHQSGAVNGTITVPVTIGSTSAGKVKVQDIDIDYVVPPKLLSTIPTQNGTEEGINVTDFAGYFSDDLPGLAYAVNYTSTKIVLSMTGARMTIDATGTNASNFYGDVTGVTVTVTDTDGLKVTSNTFTVSIRNVNDPPVFTNAAPDSTATVGTVYTATLSASDPDPSPTLTFSVVEDESARGVVVDPVSGDLSWKPGFRYADATAHLVVQVSDGIALPAKQTWDVNVAKGLLTNHPPSITLGEPAPVTVNTNFTLDASLAANDVDTFDVLEYTLEKSPVGMTIGKTSGMISWRPTVLGREEVNVSVSDGVNSASDAIQIWVISDAGSNSPPRFTSTPPTDPVKAGDSWVYVPEATDADPLTYLKYDVEWDLLKEMQFLTELSFDEESHSLAWQTAPGAADTGVHTLTVTVSDGVAVVEQMVNITVIPKGPDFSVTFGSLPVAQLTGHVTVTVEALDRNGGAIDSVEISIGDNDTWKPMTKGALNNWTYDWDTGKTKGGILGIVFLYARAKQGSIVSPEVTTSAIVKSSTTGDWLAACGALILVIILVPIILVVVVVMIIFRRKKQAPPPQAVPPGMPGGPGPYGQPGGMPPGQMPPQDLPPGTPPPSTPPPYQQPGPPTGYQPGPQQPPAYPGYPPQQPPGAGGPPPSTPPPY